MSKTAVEKLAMQFFAEYINRDPEYIDLREFLDENTAEYSEELSYDVYDEVMKAFNELRVVVKQLAR